MSKKKHMHVELPTDLKERMAQEAAEYEAANPHGETKPAKKPEKPKKEAEAAEIVEDEATKGDETEAEEPQPVTQSSPAQQGDPDQ